MATAVNHLAIIMDGNGRWAKSRGLPRAAGHKAGIKSVRAVMDGCEENGISNLTVFAFSSENWRRPKAEVRMLMDLFVSTIAKEIDELDEKNITLRFIGNTQAFEQKLQHRIQQAEFQTADNDGMRLNVAVNYGGRWDIANAAKQVAQKVQDGLIQPEQIDADVIASHMCLADSPNPDLLIRTGGESRISNFLNWQLAYSELYFTDCLWPDFDKEQLQLSLQWFAGRQRRFGRTPEQAKAKLENSHA